MTRHFIAPNGYDEPALWAEDPPRLSRPVMLVSKRQVGWDLIEKGLAAEELEARLKAVHDYEMCPGERVDCCCRTIWRLLGLGGKP